MRHKSKWGTNASKVVRSLLKVAHALEGVVGSLLKVAHALEGLQQAEHLRLSNVHRLQ